MIKMLIISVCLSVFCILEISAQTEIWTAEDLDNIRYNLDLHYVQMANIDLDTYPYNTNEGWKPIGEFTDYNVNSPFTGSYNGNGYIISNLYVSRPDNDYVGLFGFSSYASFYNIELMNVNITGNRRVGGVIGSASMSNIQNCSVSGAVSGIDDMIGGLAGMIFYSNIVNGYSEVDVQGRDYIGGIVGYTYAGSINNSSSVRGITGNRVVGGLVGTINNSIITNSYSRGNINGNRILGGLAGILSSSICSSCYATGQVSGSDYIGGFSGHKWYSTVDKCYASGNVFGSDLIGGFSGSIKYSSIDKCKATGEVSGLNQVGGFVGENYHSDVRRCYSTGFVIGNDMVGGFVGQNWESTVINCYSKSDVVGFSGVGGFAGYNDLFSYLRNSYSIGAVEGNEYVGGLVGRRIACTITHSYWNIETSGQTESAGGFGRTTDEMKFPYEINTYEGWDFEEIWAADVDYTINDGYPYLREPPVSVDDDLIAVIELPSLYNYPNPFNPETKISFTLAEAVQVRIEIYNIRGQRIKTLIDDHYDTGFYNVLWDGRDDNGKTVTSGIYFYRMTTPSYDKVNKMLLLK